MLDDLYQAETDAAIADLINRPPAAKPQASKFNAWRALTAVPRGLAAGALETGAMVPDVADTLGGAFTRAASSMLPTPRAGGRAPVEPFTGASSPEGDALRSSARDFLPDPTSAHAAEQTVFGLVKFGAKAVGSVATLGPAAGAAAVGLNEGLTTADDLKQQGVDLTTRTQVGAVAGLTAAAGVALPVAGKTAAQTAALVLAGGPVAFSAQQLATREILQGADYSKLADQYDPLDPVGLAVSTLVPAGFGVWAMRGMRKAAKTGEVKPGEAAPVQDAVQTEPAAPRPTPDQVDAARVEMLTQHVESARLTPVEDAAGARAHGEAMTRAMDQLAAGERVQVADVAPVPRAAPTDTPEFKSWFGDSKVVDEQGKPLVVYHGTGADFSEFQPSKKFGEMYFASESQSYANTMARSGFGGSAGGNVMPLFFSLKNPAVVSFESYSAKDLDAAWADNADGLIAVDADGVKQVVVAFDSTQIKSAIGNSGRFDPNSPSLTDSRFASWADQINAAIADIRAAAAKEAPANVQDAPQARTDAPAGAARQPQQGAQPQAADARGPGPAGAGEPGTGGVPRAGAGDADARLVAQRLDDVARQFPDLTVQMDGMAEPVRLADFLAQVQREAMEGTDEALGGNDASLMQVAAACALLNGV